MYFNDMFIHILAVIIFSLELKKMKNYGKWFSTPIKWKKFLSHLFLKVGLKFNKIKLRSITLTFSI